MRVYESPHMSDELKYIASKKAFVEAHNDVDDEWLYRRNDDDIVGAVMKMLGADKR